jgi:hypothetical protein
MTQHDFARAYIALADETPGDRGVMVIERRGGKSDRGGPGLPASGYRRA